jgi:small-conductance mechanosensitive channel
VLPARRLLGFTIDHLPEPYATIRRVNRESVTSLVTIVAAGLAAGAGAWIVSRVTLRIGRRHDLPSLVALDRSCRQAWVCTAMAIAALSAANSRDVDLAWRRAAVLAVIATACWLIVRLLVIGEQLLLGRLNMNVEDNRRIRRARTQVTLLRRVLAAVVIVLGLAACLMSFPDLRTFGASLLASAGLAGIVAGLAAQTTLANMFAGLQLAFTDAVRIDDVVVVEDEWGWIEELTLTYVVVHIWDERRLVLPTSYFTSTPFQNWTRTEARLLGAVTLHLDYATPLGPLREYAHSVIKASPLWDGKDWVLQVVDTTATTMVVRILASAADASSAWDLRCDVREALIVYLQQNNPQALPVTRVISMDEPAPADAAHSADSAHSAHSADSAPADQRPVDAAKPGTSMAGKDPISRGPH